MAAFYNQQIALYLGHAFFRTEETFSMSNAWMFGLLILLLPIFTEYKFC